MTYIQRLNDEEMINLDDLGIRTRDFIVHSPSYIHTFEEVEGMDGVIDLGSKIGPRQITCLFKFIADDWINFGQKRDEIFNLFESKEPFYLIEKRNLFKRWLVKVDDSFDISQRNIYGDFEINFIAIKGYAESIGTSTQAKTFEHLQELPVTYTDYTMEATKFKIYNPGQPIDPRNINHYLKITYKGRSYNLSINNKTTGDVWQYLGTSNTDDEIVLEGIRSTKNGLSIFRQTNKRLITLAHGWNYFEIRGAPDAQRFAVQQELPRRKGEEYALPNPITFEFKFLF